VVSGIKNLVEADIPIGVTVVLTKKNIMDLKKTIEFLDTLGVKHVKVSGLINQGRMTSRSDLVPEFSAVKREIGRAMHSPSGKLVVLFEKLPLCVAPAREKAFFFEEQHKEKMLTCPPNKEECVECRLRHKCMCT